MTPINPLIQRAPDVHVGSTFFGQALADPESINLSAAESHHGPPRHIIQAFKDAVDSGHVHYGSMRGDPELRSAISDNVKERFGVSYDPQTEVLVTSGASAALFASIWTFVGEGDEVVTPDPTYSFIFEKTRLVGGTPVSARETSDPWDMISDIEGKISAKTKILVLVQPNNPTGLVYSKECLRAISEIARKHDLVVISDQVYDEILYGGKKFHSILEEDDMKDRTILINSFSKSFGMSGLRVGYLTTSKEIMRHLFKIQANDNPHPSVPAQLAAATGLREPKNFLRDWLVEFERRRDNMVDSLNKINGIRCAKPDGGMVLFPDLSAFGDSESISTLLVKKAKVVVYPGTWYGNYGQGHVRACFTSVSEEMLEKAVQRIKEALEGSF
ncbi:MAG TPA: pyridoxal phosphate-dependent aminotransferase [Nitrososphaerales archaeon]|nr:pyridoxal phosphate-dependent aminotransferase [Nitrososphaerales archaeon]